MPPTSKIIRHFQGCGKAGILAQLGKTTILLDGNKHGRLDSTDLCVLLGHISPEEIFAVAACFSRMVGPSRGYEDILRHTLSFLGPEENALAHADSITLQNHDFDQKAARYLSKMLEHPTCRLQKLSIVHCNLTKKTVKSLCEAIANNT